MASTSRARLWKTCLFPVVRALALGWALIWVCQAAGLVRAISAETQRSPAFHPIASWTETLKSNYPDVWQAHEQGLRADFDLFPLPKLVYSLDERVCADRGAVLAAVRSASPFFKAKIRGPNKACQRYIDSIPRPNAFGMW